MNFAAGVTLVGFNAKLFHDDFFYTLVNRFVCHKVIPLGSREFASSSSLNQNKIFSIRGGDRDSHTSLSIIYSRIKITSPSRHPPSTPDP